MPDATTYSAKKAKTTSTGPLLYSELDISNLTVDATLMGSNETRFATVKYNDARMVYQWQASARPCACRLGSDSTV